MRNLLKIVFPVAAIFLLLHAYGCNRRVAPKSAKVDKTRKLKCRCGKTKFPKSHYQVTMTSFDNR